MSLAHDTHSPLQDIDNDKDKDKDKDNDDDHSDDLLMWVWFWFAHNLMHRCMGHTARRARRTKSSRPKTSSMLFFKKQGVQGYEI